MHILIVTRKAHLGTANYIGTILQGLAVKGHTCDVMLRSGRALCRIRKLAQKRYNIPHNVNATYKHTLSIIKNRKPDVAYIVLSDATLPVLKACNDVRFPVVVSIVNRTNLEEYIEELRQVSSIIVLNRYNQNLYSKLYPDLAPNIHLGAKIINREIFKPAALTPARNLKIACIGRLSSSKGELALKVMDAVLALQKNYPQLELSIVGTGTRLLAAKLKALRFNLKSRKTTFSVLGGISEPQGVMQNSGIVLAAGFSAAEALSCHCKVIGLGFYGLFGHVTAANIDAAIDANFGDTDAICPNPSVTDIAQAINVAIRASDETGWIEQVFKDKLNPEQALIQLIDLLNTAIHKN